MKFWSSEYVFNHPWEKVTQAAWRKYPNPMNPSVTAMDVVNRSMTDGVLRTHRIVGCHWGLPSWITTIVGSPNVMYGNERSEVDPGNQLMTLKTRNITLCNYIAVDEKLEYQRHPQDQNKTILRQEAIVTVEGVPLSNYLEDLLTSTISTNANKGRQAMEWVLRKINDELKEFTYSVEKNKDLFFNQTKKSIDELSLQAKKSLDELSALTAKPSSSVPHPHTMPDL